MIMCFLVNLIEVNNTSCRIARDDLYANCTHVANNYWLYEGIPVALHDGITFDLVCERVIEGTGDLSQDEIRRMVIEVYDVDPVFMQ